MRTSCYIIEEREGEFFCDCYEGSKGKLCKHSVGMNYFVGNLNVEDDVRAVPLGGKRKRGRPKRNPHCLTRSPSQGETTEDVLNVNEDVVGEISEDVVDVQSSQAGTALVQPSSIDEMMTEDFPPPSNSLGSEDLCLQLEDSASDSEEDMTIIGADPAFNFKPPKKAKRDVTEVLLAAGGRNRREMGSRTRRGGRGRSIPPLSPSTCSSSSAHVGMSSSRGRGSRGRPRGSRGGRGRGTASASTGNPSSISAPSVSDGMASGSSSRGTRGRPRGSRGKRGRGTASTSSSPASTSSSPEGIPECRSTRAKGTRGRHRGSSS